MSPGADRKGGDRQNRYAGGSGIPLQVLRQGLTFDSGNVKLCDHHIRPLSRGNSESLLAILRQQDPVTVVLQDQGVNGERIWIPVDEQNCAHGSSDVRCEG